ncbi:MAG: SMP-30/gluconolactonase/LRE family protein [Bacteroidota bacterium]
MNYFPLPFLLLISLINITGCTTKRLPDKAAIIAQLLRSNEIQRRAHLENDANLLASQIADSMMSVSRGEISFSANSAIQQRFEGYFQQVRYSSWDDTRKPIIEIAQDGQTASIYVQKFLDLQFKKQETEWGEHQYALFAWQAQYALVNGGWKITANTSSDKSLSKQEALDVPIHLSELYAEIKESDLIPEGIAHDNKTGITYVSSTYKQKILAVNPNGSYTDWKTEGEDGLWSTVGMEVDEETRILWVISFHGHEVLPMKRPQVEHEWTSRLYAFHLPDGALIDSYEPDVEEKVAFNDLCVAKDGNVYVTESLNNRIFYLNPDNGSFQQLDIQDSLFVFPNGITISDDQSFLYIAVQSGIIQYSLRDKTFGMLQLPSGILANRIDGLAYYKGSLIANQSYRKRILQLSLNEESRSVRHQRILEANHPAFDQPATGEIAGDAFIYLANAQMQSAFDNGVLKPEEERESVKLLKVDLPQE